MYLTDGSWFQVSCMAVRVHRTVSIMADQEEENNTEATGDTHAQSFQILSMTYFLQIYFAQFPDTPKTGTPAGMQHLKHEPIGESDLNCLYLCWAGEPTYSAGKSCMTKLGNVLQNALPVSPQFSMLWNPGRLNCLNQGKFRRQEDS